MYPIPKSRPSSQKNLTDLPEAVLTHIARTYLTFQEQHPLRSMYSPAISNGFSKCNHKSTYQTDERGYSTKGRTGLPFVNNQGGFQHSGLSFTCGNIIELSLDITMMTCHKPYFKFN